ncbi:MAG: hypothetical protein IJ214_12875 [Clostridia bacterium]|nr:hypothetical protein [Clostridia bacterium]
MAAIFGAITALFLLAAVCLRVRVGSRFHRGITRGVYAVWALMLLSLIPGFRAGVNTLTVACAGALGLPGIGLMQVIALMRN